MPQFTIQVPDGRKVTVQADSQDQAISGVQDWYAKNPAQPSSTSPGPQPIAPFDQNAPQTPGATGNNPMAQNVPGGSSLPPASFDDMVRSFGANIDQIPVAGPSIYNAMRNARASVQGMTPDQVDAETARARTIAPGADLGGKAFYNIAPYAAAASLGPVARMLGIAGADLPATASLGSKALDLMTRTGAAFGSNEAIGTADSMARGASLPDAARENLLPSAAIGALPLAGATVRAAGRGAKFGANWLMGGAPSTIRDALNTTRAAEKAVGKSYLTDVANGSALSPALEASAASNGQPIVNLDRGGSVTRSLARTASNVSQDAEAALKGATDRGPASTRAADFLKTLVGGSADDLALRQGIQDTGRFVNGKAYAKAEASPAAANIFSPRIENLMQAPEMQQAIREAEGSGKTAAAIAGRPAPGPAPFKIAPDGSVISTPVVPPSLKFWDQVQRNLRKQMDALGPKEKAKWSDLDALRKQLLGELDSTVPDFQTARMGASKFFGAENALDAGRQFAKARGQVPEAKAAYAKFSDPEKKAFGIGWASEQIDKLGTKDSYAAIKQVFENPNAREMSALALGPQKAAQLEAFLKVESMMQFSSDALRGNSSTAKQLAMMGAVGVGTGGYGMATGDWRPLSFATALGAGRAGMQYLGKSVDQKVMGEVARLLSSGNRADLNKVVQNAAMSPAWKGALDAVFQGMGAVSRGGVDAATKPPIQITVNGGSAMPQVAQ